MSDLDPVHDDELVSAYLDGEATPAEHAAVEGRADLLARADQLRRVADLVGDEPADGPSPDERDLAVAAALSAAALSADDAPAGGPEGGPVDGPGDEQPVTDLDAARARRRTRPLVWLGAAAAVVLVLAVGSTVLRRRGETDVVTGSAALSALPGEPSTSFQPTGNAVAGETPAGNVDAADNADTTVPPQAAAAAPGAGGAAAPVPLGNLGTFADTTELAVALRSRTSGAGLSSSAAAQRTTTTVAAADQGESAVVRCDAPARTADPSVGVAVADGQATVAGQSVLFIVYSGAAPTLVVVDPSCTVLSSGPL